MTPLDLAHERMQALPDHAPTRLTFYDHLAGTELFLLLEDEPEGDSIRPRIFPVEESRFALVFDRPERLTEFAEGPVPYAALSGKVLAGMLKAQGIGLGVNLGVAPSSILIDAGAVDWLAETTGEVPDVIEDAIREVTPPVGLPEEFLEALDRRLASVDGLARHLYLVGVTYLDGRRGHLAGFIDYVHDAEPALADTVAAALTFSGVAAGSIDVGFFQAADPISAKLAKVGLRFDLPERQAPASRTPSAPGMDPDAPPKLR